MAEPTTLSIICVGATDDALRALLRDVLADQEIRAYFAPRWHRTPDLVLAAVRQWDVTSVMSAARAAAGAAPILVILPFSDERLVKLAIALGARAWFALDMPLSALAEAIGAIVPRVAAGSPEGAPA